MEAITPNTYEEISGCLGKLTSQSKVLGGGTDYIIRLNMGTEAPDYLCYLGRVKELKAVEANDGGITIGAYVTMTELEHHPVIRTRFPALAQAASDVGSLQIRNRATIGGNIGNASPAGDLLPVLYLYEAKLTVIGPDGSRVISIEEVIERPGRTTLACNEAIVGISMAYPSYESAFVKLGTRKKVTISRIGIALGLAMDHDRIGQARIYVGAISARPVALKEAEQLLAGKVRDEAAVLSAAQILSDYIMEHTPKEFDRDYKVYSAKGIVQDVFDKICR